VGRHDYNVFREYLVPLFESIDKRNGKAKATTFIRWLTDSQNFVNRSETTEAVIAGGGTVIPIVPPSPSTANLLPVVNTVSAFVGQFVSCAGNTLAIADATTAPSGIQATHVVVATDAIYAYLASVWEDIDVALLGGSGNDGNGNIYLATGGRVTRDKSEIANDEGGLVGSYKLLQNLGTWTDLAGSVAPSYTRSSVKVSDASLRLAPDS